MINWHNPFNSFPPYSPSNFHSSLPSPLPSIFPIPTQTALETIKHPNGKISLRIKRTCSAYNSDAFHKLFSLYHTATISRIRCRSALEIQGRRSRFWPAGSGILSNESEVPLRVKTKSQIHKIGQVSNYSMSLDT